MPQLSTNAKSGLVLGCAALAIIILLIFNGNRENPHKLTQDRLQALEEAVVTFIQKNGRAPTALSELSLPEASLMDHIGEPFIYLVDEQSVTIITYGADKKPGGFSFKRDSTVVIDL